MSIRLRRTASSASRAFSTIAASLTVSALALLSGCSHLGTSESPVNGLAISGHMHGGQQPVTGVNVQLYAVGTTGDSSAATALLTKTVTTDQYGNFNITGDYTCPTSSTEVYLVGTGGNPGLTPGTNNTALAMMAALGPCGSMGSIGNLFVDEVTTIGSLAALYPYMSSYSTLGSGTVDAASLQAAFSEVNEYTSINNGTAPGPALPPGYYASSNAINSLANAVSSCINSAGGVYNDGSACGSLFLFAKPSNGPAPTDTIGAILDILNNPTSNVTAIYNLSPSTGAPFQPTLTSAPANWTFPIIQIPATPIFSPGGGPYVGTQSVSISDTSFGVSIYYTTDGSTPTTASTLYTSPISVPSSVTLKAIAAAGTIINSAVATASYAISAPPPAIAPTFSPGTGSYSSSQTVTISSTTPAATIYYTTDGSTPTTASNLYTGPITVYTSETVQAIAISAVTAASPAGSATYTLSNIYGTITTFAGNGVSSYLGDGGLATSAEIYNPYNTAIDSNGNVYIADFSNNRIRKVTPGGVISTVAGTGVTGYNGDGGLAVNATVWGPSTVAVDSQNNLYIADDFNYRIRKVNAAGIISTVAGNGVDTYSGDGGLATSASFHNICGMAIDINSSLYLADCNTSGNRIRKVTSAGIISTVAGNGNAGFGGDGGLATSATLYGPQSVAVDISGNIYISDYSNNRIRKVNTAGIISTIAGTGTASYGGDGGAATSAYLDLPQTLVLDTAGNLYVADSLNNRIRKITPGGIISTVAGNGTLGFTGDGGPATGAELDNPSGIMVDPSGNLFIGDLRNNRIRKVTYSNTAPQVVAPAFSVAAGTYNATQYVTLSTTTTGASIYYTTDNSTPTTSSPLYSGVITVSSSETIKAIAVENGYLNSTTSSAAYVITNLSYTPTPAFSPVPGSYTSTQSVTLSSISGASIYYTTDGTTPTTSSTLYNGAITVSTSTTINAIATASGYAPSAVGSGGYYINQGIGIITTIAGNGTGGFLGDGGQGTSAEVYAPRSVAVDASGNVYIADTSNNRIRKVTPAGVITTVAGNGTATYAGDGGLATSASLSTPSGVAVDGAGNLYIADSYNYRIRKVNSSGIISTYAGNGTGTYSGDGGLATSAGFGYVPFIALDNSGNLYLSDPNTNRVRKISAAGIITTVAGTGTSGFSGDGSAATSATLNDPAGVAVDSNGNLYIADFYNNRIRKVNAAGIISTVAGTGGYGSTGDGSAATSATIYYPEGVAVDTAGSFYIADYEDSRIRKVNSAGIISTIAGTGTTGYNGDGEQATAATLYYAQGVAVDSIGNVYIGDTTNQRVRKISYGNAFAAAAPTFSVPAGSYTAVQYLSITSTTPGVSIYYTTDGTTPTINSTLYTAPLALSTSQTINAIAAAGGYAASPVTSAAYSITVLPTAATPTFSPSAGTFGTAQLVAISTTSSGTSIYYTLDGSTPTTSSSHYTGAITVATSETINAIAAGTGYNPSYIGTAGFYINPGPGIITTIAGTGTYGYSGDGYAATSASLAYPRGTAIDGAGNLYIADASNNRIRKVTPAGIITTVAGNGTSGYSGDNGLATSAELYSPQGVAVDAAGNLYIADSSNYRIRKVTPAGIITTIAGTGVNGHAGDGGSALSATFGNPIALALDNGGNLYIADSQNNTVRKLTPAGIINIFAGSGTYGYNGDGSAATSASFENPYGVAVDAAGNVYIADYYNYRVRKVNTSGIISTFVGNGGYGYGGDGGLASSTSAKITYPTSVAVDSAGNVYIGDSSNYRIRMVNPAGILSTAVGNGTYGFTGDLGSATGAEISASYGITTDSSGNIYFSDTSNYRVRKVTH